MGVGEDVEEVVAVECRRQLSERLAVLHSSECELAFVALAIEPREQFGRDRVIDLAPPGWAHW